MTKAMEMVMKRNVRARLKRLTIGCGIQGDHGLALAVRGREGMWSIEWGLFGTRHDPQYARALSKRVWRRPFWGGSWDIGFEREVVTIGVDLSFVSAADGKQPGTKEIKAALRTQLMARYPHPSKPSALIGVEMRGPGGERHVIGSVVEREAVQHSYKEWNEDVGILYPHVGCSALAVANIYLALYPESLRAKNPVRLLVLEGREITHAVLMDDWRLLNCIQYQMMQNQKLDRPLLEEWIAYLQNDYALDTQPIPCVLKSREGLDPDYLGEVWSPFQDETRIKCDEPTLKLIEEHADLAPLAFGMALQGG
jgi:hypothetical protein